MVHLAIFEVTQRKSYCFSFLQNSGSHLRHWDHCKCWQGWGLGLGRLPDSAVVTVALQAPQESLAHQAGERFWAGLWQILGGSQPNLQSPKLNKKPHLHMHSTSSFSACEQDFPFNPTPSICFTPRRITAALSLLGHSLKGSSPGIPQCELSLQG